MTAKGITYDFPPANPATDTVWLDTLRVRLRELPLNEHDAIVRSLIVDWSNRYTGAERLAEDRAPETRRNAGL